MHGQQKDRQGSAGQATNSVVSTAPIVAMMMAMDRNRLIGSNGKLPWHIPGELAYFKAVTMGKPVIMGRRTFESIGKPLPGRTNVVVTRNETWSADGVLVAATLKQALSLAEGVLGADGVSSAADVASVADVSSVADVASAADVSGAADGSRAGAISTSAPSVKQTRLHPPDAPELMIIGGAALCHDAMPLTQRLYLTVVDHAFDGDTWLDCFFWHQWQVVSEDVRDPATTDGLPVTYWVLEKP